jgi:hypothetical protein
MTQLNELEAAALALYPISEFPIGSGDTSRLFDENYRDRKLFIKGAKWQAERMYSEEEVIELLNKHEDYVNSEDNIFEYLTAKEWFKQYKKK